MRHLLLACLRTLCVLASAVPPVAAAAPWPAWRGPTGDGICTETNVPVHWNRLESVRWRAPLPEPGNSTPIVWSNAVFITQNIGSRRSLMAFHRPTGRPLWTAGVEGMEGERTHESNPYCSASPVTDGEHVICWFGSSGVVAYDFHGAELWRADLGVQDHEFGYGSSPVLHGDLCFLNFGPGVREFLVALDKRNGREVWRVTSPTPGAEDPYGTWSTPLFVQGPRGPELIVALRDYFAGLDPATGHELWRCRGFGLQAKSSPVAGEGRVVLAGDLQSAELAVELGGRGDITDSHRLWRETPPRKRVGTGVIHGGHCYSARSGGILDCVELLDGEVKWAGRQRGEGANTAIWSSPVLANGLLYFVNQSGETVIVKAATEFFQVAVNPLGEPCNASPAISEGMLFLRTHRALWCIH